MDSFPDGAWKAESMTPTITMTNFLDYVSRPGTRRWTEVKRMRQQYARDYHPAIDYYSEPRDVIVSVHREGASRAGLDRVVAVARPGEQANFRKVIAGHGLWDPGPDATWFDPPKNVWEGPGINIRVNPELGLVIGGVPYVIKLYFRKDELDRPSVPPLLHLLRVGCAQHLRAAVPAILDVPRGKLRTKGLDRDGLDVMLHAEAQSLAIMWQGQLAA